MRKLKYLLLLSIVCNLAYSQDTIVVYYNHDWKEIDNKDYASFYRKSFIDSAGTWAVYDYFISGKIQMSGAYKTKKEKKQIGTFTYYYENGQRQSHGNYNVGVKVGKWTQWYENGALKSEGEYTEDELSGTWQYWHENGEKKSVGNYFSGKREGEWQFWYENRKPEASGNYKNFRRDGNWVYYYENGQKSREGIFKEGLGEGEWTFWFESGEQKAKGVIISDKREGTWKFWHKNGNLKSDEIYVKGELTSSVGYHPNGKPYYIGNYQNGVRHGKWTYRNATGRKYLEGSFHKGKNEGEWVRYFPDSEIKLYYEKGIVQNKRFGGILNPGN